MNNKERFMHKMKKNFKHIKLTKMEISLLKHSLPKDKRGTVLKGDMLYISKKRRK